MDVGAFGTCVSWIVRDPHRQLHSTPKDLCWQPSSFSKNSGKNLFPLENSMHIISKKCKGSCYRSCICLFPLLIHLSNLGAVWLWKEYATCGWKNPNSNLTSRM